MCLGAQPSASRRPDVAPRIFSEARAAPVRAEAVFDLEMEGADGARSFTLTGLEEGEKYFFELRAVNEPGLQGVEAPGAAADASVTVDGTPPALTVASVGGDGGLVLIAFGEDLDRDSLPRAGGLRGCGYRRGRQRGRGRQAGAHRGCRGVRARQRRARPLRPGDRRRAQGRDPGRAGRNRAAQPRPARLRVPGPRPRPAARRGRDRGLREAGGRCGGRNRAPEGPRRQPGGVLRRPCRDQRAGGRRAGRAGGAGGGAEAGRRDGHGADLADALAQRQRAHRRLRAAHRRGRGARRRGLQRLGGDRRQRRRDREPRRNGPDRRRRPLHLPAARPGQRRREGRGGKRRPRDAGRRRRDPGRAGGDRTGRARRRRWRRPSTRRPPPTPWRRRWPPGTGPGR